MKERDRERQRERKRKTERGEKERDKVLKREKTKLCAHRRELESLRRGAREQGTRAND